MSDSISTSSRRETSRTGNRVVQSALGSPTQHARKNLLRNKNFKSSTLRADPDAESEGVEGRLDERTEQTVACARSLAATVNQLQQATNLISRTQNALDTVLAENSAFVLSLSTETADLVSPSLQPLSEGLALLSVTVRRILTTPLANGKALFGQHGPWLLREILADLDTDESVCSEYSRIVKQATRRLAQLDHALNAFSSNLNQSDEPAPVVTINNLLGGIAGSLSHDREALSLLQDKLSAILRNSLIVEVNTKPGVAGAATPSTHQALSERTKTQLLSRTGAAMIYNDVESGLVKSLLRD